MIKKIQPDKIILALLILSAVLFPVTIFGLSVLDEGFIPVGIVFGINTLLFFIIYLDMKTKKVLSFISYGLFCFLQNMMRESLSDLGIILGTNVCKHALKFHIKRGSF